jgi:hypothetical protein
MRAGEQASRGEREREAAEEVSCPEGGRGCKLELELDTALSLSHGGGSSRIIETPACPHFHATA